MQRDVMVVRNKDGELFAVKCINGGLESVQDFTWGESVSMYLGEPQDTDEDVLLSIPVVELGVMFCEGSMGCDRETAMGYIKCVSNIKTVDEFIKYFESIGAEGELAEWVIDTYDFMYDEMRM